MRQLPRFIGMVHLPPLPGSPGSALSLAACEAHALADARALAAGGADGLIVENFGDAPFRRGRVDPHTVAAMTRIALRIRIGVHATRETAGVLVIGTGGGLDSGRECICVCVALLEIP